MVTCLILEKMSLKPGFPKVMQQKSDRSGIRTHVPEDPGSMLFLLPLGVRRTPDLQLGTLRFRCMMCHVNLDKLSMNCLKIVIFKNGVKSS